MVIFSVSIRALVFTSGGLMLADRLVGFAILLPFALAGLLRVVAGLLLLIGLSLLARALAGG